MPKVEVRTVKLSELKPYPRNPRRISDKALNGLGTSIDKYGLVQPIVWNVRSGYIVGGHQRFYCLQSSGETETEVMVVDLSSDKERLLNILLNNDQIEGGWTPSVIDLLDTIESDQKVLYDSLNFDDLYDSLTDKKGAFVDPRASKKTKSTEIEKPKSIIQEDELWILGTHRLLCGSSGDKGCVKRVLDGVRVDCVITDPPYGIGYRSINKKEVFGIENDELEDYPAFFEAFLKHIPMSDENSAFIFMFDAKLGDLCLAAESSGFTVEDWIVWVKDSFVLGRGDYNYSHEFCLHAWKGASKKIPDGVSNVLECSRPKTSKIHPTMKPVELIEHIVSIGSEPNDIVYEPFGGSGSTLIACENQGRQCRLIELEGFYCDRILDRWLEHTKLDPVRDGDNKRWSEWKREREGED